MTSESRGSSLRRLRHAAGAFLCLLLLVQAMPGAAGPDQTKDELDKAKRQVNRLAGELEDAQAHLEQVNADLQEVTARVAQYTNQIEALRAAIVETRKAIRRAGKEIDGLQDNLNDRARTVYINGPASALELVLEAESLTNLTDRLSYLEALNRVDADLATGIEVQQEQLRQHEEDLQGYREELEPLRQQAKEDQEELLAKQEAARDARAALAAKRQEAEELVEELEDKYERELEEQRRRLAAARAAAAAATVAPATSGDGGGGGPPVSGDGPFYVCPVDSPRSYIDDFGYPRSGGRSHQGNDVFAPYGTVIRAPFAGTARESSNSLGGLAVYVYGSGGTFVYNAHLSRYAGVNGQHVTPGTVIGYVGTSGNAQGTSPHDHFEYHPGGGAAVSPYPYLNEVCGVGGAG